MKLNKSKLRKIIKEEIEKAISEQEEDTGSVELSQDAKRDTQAVATMIMNSASSIVSAVESFKESNPNLDHSKVDQAVDSIKKAVSDVGEMLGGVINETDDDDLSEIIRKLASGDYRVYSKKKNPKTGKRRNLGTYKSKSGAEEREKDINFFKTLK